MTYWVYILKCADDSYYTGHTDCLDARMNEHKYRVHASCYTATRLPVELVFVQEHVSREDALSAERQIKGWSRKKKEALISGDYDRLKSLSKRKK